MTDIQSVQTKAMHAYAVGISQRYRRFAPATPIPSNDPHIDTPVSDVQSPSMETPLSQASPLHAASLQTPFIPSTPIVDSKIPIVQIMMVPIKAAMNVTDDIDISDSSTSTTPNYTLTCIWKVPVLGDGSCFFHSCLYSTSHKYRQSSTAERIDMARKLRRHVAEILPKCYNYICDGILPILSKTQPELSLGRLIGELLSTSSVEPLYHELISSILGVSISVVDCRTGRYIVKPMKRYEKMITLIYTPGHYEAAFFVVKDDNTNELKYTYTLPTGFFYSNFLKED